MGVVTTDPLLDPLPDLLARLETDGAGLTPEEAARRLTEVGPNLLSVTAGTSLLSALLRQLVHPLALLLWGAAALALSTQGPTLGVAIIAVIALNAAFALAQERHAEHAVAALSAYLPQRALVVRGGHRLQVDAREIVPGDLVVIEEGESICADARLVSGSLEVDLSAMSGESLPAVREAGEPDGPEAPRLVAARNVVLSGTTCLSGEGTAVVVHTGMTTELGRIAGLSSRTGHETSPLERQVRRVAWMIAAVAVGVGLAFLPLGMLAGLGFTDASVFAIGLLVANVPEGLLPTITLALAVGVAELAKRGGLVKRLSAVETLGSTDVICTDKTGTLTQNRMHLHSVWDATARSAPEPPVATALVRVLATCTTADRETGVGDPTELALLGATSHLGVETWPPDRRERMFHFDPRLRLMSVVALGADGTRVVLTKGAPEAVVARCTTVLTQAGATVPLTGALRANLDHRLPELAGRGLRLLGCGTRLLGEHPPEDREAVEQELTLVGFVALADPLRDAVPAAVGHAHQAGLVVHVISGDNGATAAAIARSAGIARDPVTVVAGAELDRMPDDELDALLGRGEEIVFARSSPEDKLRIATRLQAAGHVVAMTGDGVNDAPALRQADIGVAMGVSGTDVAREAATMVLTDDDFATIVRAIESGRRVYDNVRKFILYIFAHAVPEIVPFLLFALSGGAIPLGLTVTQILLIDLGTETLPALALGREAAEPGLMQRPPRRRHESLITAGMLLRAWGILGVVSALLVTTGFLGVLWTAGWRPGDATGAGSALHEDYLTATTMTFAGIVACQIGTAMAARTDRVSLLSIGVLSNRLLVAGILFEVVLAAAVIYLPAAQDLLGTRPLGLGELAFLATFPIVVWGVDEAYRAIRRRR
ncbi:cation-translocating P-type ATPase [Nocardioides sp. T2.26MG-1]|uniref:cation-translocating P-type ATPase n=1 Tax=Nocardioides sp. T2.26MG-1 TaxID=3041166 RepID=UPI002477558D|nr:cation-transporting P-type ATPase [Nocardioides sp. T2.26MG-1]CAI9413806.1 Calcium-transporting ATPase 1 [Nocardioides sp. T2.26MG-1]